MRSAPGTTGTAVPVRSRFGRGPQRGDVAGSTTAAGTSRWSSSIRFNASHLSAEAARAIEISPTRSTCGTRRSRAAISSCNSRMVCERPFAAVVSGVIDSTAAPAARIDAPDSRPHRSENTASNYSRQGFWPSTRLTSTCRTDTIAARRQQHSRSHSFDRRSNPGSPSDRPIEALRGLVTGIGRRTQEAGITIHYTSAVYVSAVCASSSVPGSRRTRGGILTNRDRGAFA